MKRKEDGSYTPEQPPLSQEMADFVFNERLLCQIDYRYWCERYCSIEFDSRFGGGIHLMSFWTPQELAFRLIQERELTCFEEWQAGEPSDGILLAWHKARQLGATAFLRSLEMHRMSTGREFRALAGSADENLLQELYSRDSIIFQNLPWYLSPRRIYDVKTSSMEFENNCRMMYQHSRQSIGLGTGRQFDITHLTECSLWEIPSAIEFSLLPAIPQSHRTLLVLESTANGRDYFWMPFTESIRKRQRVSWSYCFVPYYAEPMKYSRKPPTDWIPSDLTVAHANKIYETSPEFFFGQRVTPSKYTLYWWETSRDYYIRSDNLAYFLINYPATPEESFQDIGKSGYSNELTEKWRLAASWDRATPYALPATIYQ